jgi:hypothetical protein
MKFILQSTGVFSKITDVLRDRSSCRSNAIHRAGGWPTPSPLGLFSSDPKQTAKSGVQEIATRQGTEYRHGGSNPDHPVCDDRSLSLPKRADLVEVRKGPRPQSLRRCLRRELHELIPQAKRMANEFQKSSDLWTGHHLTQRCKEIDVSWTQSDPKSGTHISPSVLLSMLNPTALPNCSLRLPLATISIDIPTTGDEILRCGENLNWVPGALITRRTSKANRSTHFVFLDLGVNL